MRTILLLTLCSSAFCLEGCNETKRDPWLANDKAEHFLAGAVVGGVTRLMIDETDLKPWQKNAVAIGAAVLAGTLKELFDSRHPGTHDASVKDAAWTYAGGAVGCIGIEISFTF